MLAPGCEHAEPACGETLEHDEQWAADQLDEFFWHFDMLCDGDRNAFFDQALQHTIARMHGQDVPVHVLDIGTGSGLLALLANRHGADAVTAIERVPKLADIAARHFKTQAAAVCLLRGSSRDLSSWPPALGGDSDAVVVTNGQLYTSRPNLVVAELLETSLLGEGVLPTLRHAAAHLLAPGFTAIPAATKVYARLVRGEALRNSETVPDVPESRPGACSGVVAPWHVHAEAMRQQGLISYVSDAFEVLQFDWDGELPGSEGRSVTKHVTLSSAGSVDGILMHWTCTMAPGVLQAELSTAPNATYQRDHWRQAIYTRCANDPLVREHLAAGLDAGTQLEVTAHHDDHEIWFTCDVVGTDPASQSSDIEQLTICSRSTASPTVKAAPRPLCSCGLHTTLSRNACWARNDVQRQARLQQAGCKAGDADCGDGPLAQMRWVQDIGSQDPTTSVREMGCRFPCRVDVYAQAIRCPAVIRQFESTNGQPPFQRTPGPHDKYLVQVAEMDSLRASRLGVVVPRTVALWEFPHDRVSAPVLVNSIQRKDLSSMLTSGRLDFGPGSSSADSVAVWCDLVYERPAGDDKSELVLPGGTIGGLHQMCDVVPIAWGVSEHAFPGTRMDQSHNHETGICCRIRLDWASNWAQCVAMTAPRVSGTNANTARERTGRRKAPRYG